MGPVSPGQVRCDELSQRGLTAIDCRHLDAVMDIARTAFAKRWTRQDFAYFLAHEYGRCYGVVAPDGRLVAYFLGLWAQGDLDVISLATHESARRQGLGERLLRYAMAQEDIERTLLEVAVDNEAAIALYTKLGFVKAGVRKGYYEGRGEAHLMTCGSSSSAAGP